MGDYCLIPNSGLYFIKWLKLEVLNLRLMKQIYTDNRELDSKKRLC